MKKAKRELLEYAPARDGAVGLMDEFNRQMNGLAEGLAQARPSDSPVPRQQMPDRARREPRR